MIGTNTTFFSYSRSDSATALRIAKDLRDGGANIWLDQLDIPAGSHWDSSIEKALNASSATIVLLSPESVASNNVMDEVSYVLESGKQIIPVLIQDCNVPFRLKRLQRIDLTSNYEIGIKQLLHALNNRNDLANGIEIENKEKAEGLEDFSIPINPTEKDDNLELLLWQKAKSLKTIDAIQHYLSEYPMGENNEEAKKLLAEIKSRQTPSKNNGSAKFLIGGITLILLVGSIWFLMKSNKPSKIAPEKIVAPESKTNHKEEEDWLKTLIRYDSTAFKNYINSYPTGKYIREAKIILDSIIIFAHHPLATEKQIWRDVLIRNTLESYLMYIENFPDGNHKKIATDSIKSKIKIGKWLEGGIIFLIDSTFIHGVVVDTTDLGKMGWNVANDKCKASNASGYTGWRLPTLSESKILYALKEKIGGFKEEYYWCSTQDENNPNQYYVRRFINGYSFTNQPRFNIGVRAVRNF